MTNLIPFATGANTEMEHSSPVNGKLTAEEVLKIAECLARMQDQISLLRVQLVSKHAQLADVMTKVDRLRSSQSDVHDMMASQ